MRHKFIKKCVWFLLQNATVLLQNAIVITKCDDFTTKCDRLKNTTFITNCDSTRIFAILPATLAVIFP